MKKQYNQIILIVIALILIAGAIVGTIYYRTNSTAVVKDGSVYIPTGASFEQLVDSLKDEGEYIKNIQQFKNSAGIVGLDERVRAGHYKLKKGMSYIEVAKIFHRGLQSPVRVTFNNIRTLEQLAGKVATQIEPDSLSLRTLLLDDTTAVHYGFLESDFISMFIPNTYELYWTTTGEGFLDRMKREYDSFWNSEREERLKEIGYSREEVITLASIVYEETKMSDEMPTVAGVYVNRLKRGIPLQADPTVKFAIGDFELKRILYKHLEVDSPYNTYKHAGLPPGPICMPSIRAIDAVLNYQEHNYIYFCAKPDFSGYHNFASTLAQHNRNAREWANALNRAGIR